MICNINVVILVSAYRAPFKENKPNRGFLLVSFQCTLGPNKVGDLWPFAKILFNLQYRNRGSSNPLDVVDWLIV